MYFFVQIFMNFGMERKPAYLSKLLDAIFCKETASF